MSGLIPRPTKTNIHSFSIIVNTFIENYWIFLFQRGIARAGPSRFVSMPQLDIQNGRKISPRSSLPRALPLAPTLRTLCFVRVSPHSGGFCFSPAALPLWRVPVSGLDRIGGEILPVGLRRFAYAYFFLGVRRSWGDSPLLGGIVRGVPRYGPRPRPVVGLAFSSRAPLTRVRPASSKKGGGPYYLGARRARVR